MKKILVLCLSVLLVVSAFSGCGKSQAAVSPTASPETVSPTASPAAVSPKASPAAETVSYPVALSADQLAKFQTALTSQENYGFLFSDYNDVRDADLMQVFYTGAGMSNPQNSDKIIQAYAAEYGKDESGIDSTILTTKQIDAFLTAKTGHTLSEMKNLPSWRYVKECDAYVHYHGDTNYVEISCTDGREISEKLYEVNYTIPGGMADSNGNLHTGGTVTVKNMGDKMQFVSNSMH